MKYGLSTNTIERIQGIFSQFPEVEEVILYGLRAKGAFHPGSDVDLAVKGKARPFKVCLDFIFPNPVPLNHPENPVPRAPRMHNVRKKHPLRPAIDWEEINKAEKIDWRSPALFEDTGAVRKRWGPP